MASHPEQLVGASRKDDTRCWFPFKWFDANWVVGSSGPKEACIRWGPDPPCGGTIFRGKDMPDNTLPWAVQKWLNWYRCCLWCGFRKHVLHGGRAYWRNLTNTIEPSRVRRRCRKKGKKAVT